MDEIKNGKSGIVEGRTVHYVLNEADVLRIIEARKIRNIHGNVPRAGDHVPMMIVRVFPNEFGPDVPGVNGQCILDGEDSHWVTSVKFDERKTNGSWHWIEKV